MKTRLQASAFIAIVRVIEGGNLDTPLTIRYSRSAMNAPLEHSLNAWRVNAATLDGFELSRCGVGQEACQPYAFGAMVRANAEGKCDGRQRSASPTGHGGWHMLFVTASGKGPMEGITPTGTLQVSAIEDQAHAGIGDGHDTSISP